MSTNQIIIKNALKIFLGLVLYFFSMKFFGLENVTELRFFNFLFVLWGINSAIKQNIHFNNEDLYINNLFIGASTAILAVGLSILGLIIYISLISPSFIEILEGSFLWSNNLSLPLLIFALSIEGIASSVVCSFILMQYYKNYKPSIIL
ncbi:hypothetical protein [Tenacibaculum maritimum]|uniref:hypothetical protein n=1 Tax=Tenacibaculum maritimum TaxID=107401 RepID=UPI002307C0FB|nr:hypothetical protein [Tenacibaculum maritimum]MDB0599943.1 hypothetical protein [Tenacibaculum maritimum]MDB0611089.1 hypothetical protein [Tenacibaculum maritimum]